MSERLQQHRTGFDLQRISDMLHTFLMSLAPKSPEPEMDTAIDWEDGEIEDQTEPTARR